MIIHFSVKTQNNHSPIFLSSLYDDNLLSKLPLEKGRGGVNYVVKTFCYALSNNLFDSKGFTSVKQRSTESCESKTRESRMQSDKVELT